VQSPRENIPITPKSFRFTPRSVARPPEFVLIAFFSLLTALTFRGGLMRAMGLELVTGNGRPGVAPSGPCSDGNCLVTDHRDRTVADAASWHMDCAAVTALARARASRGCARCLAIGRMCNSCSGTRLLLAPAHQVPPSWLARSVLHRCSLPLLPDV